MATWRSGLVAVGVAEPHHPREVGYYKVLRFTRDVAVAGDHMYGAGLCEGLAGHQVRYAVGDTIYLARIVRQGSSEID